MFDDGSMDGLVLSSFLLFYRAHGLPSPLCCDGIQEGSPKDNVHSGTGGQKQGGEAEGVLRRVNLGV